MIRYGTGFQPFDFPPSNRLPGALPQAGMIRAFGALFSRLPMCKLLGMLTAAEIRVRCKIHRRFGNGILAGSGSLLPPIPYDDIQLRSQAPQWLLAASRLGRQQIER